MRDRRPIQRLILMPLVLCLGGCITGDEAEEAMGHDKSAELEEARRLHELGAISDTEYELRKARIEREVEASGR